MAVLFGSMSSGRIFAYAPDIMKARDSAASIMNLLESTSRIDSWSTEGERIEMLKVTSNLIMLSHTSKCTGSSWT